MQVVDDAATAMELGGQHDVLFVAHEGDFVAASVVDRHWRHGCPRCVVNRLTVFATTYRASQSNSQSIDDLCEVVLRAYHEAGLYAAAVNYGNSGPTINLPVPGCAACQNVPRPYNSAQRLGSHYGLDTVSQPAAAPASTSDVLERSVKPGTFVASVEGFIGPLGIVMPLVRQTSPFDDAVHVNAAQVLGEGTGIDVAGGKGWGYAQSEASCVGEALERYFLSGVYAEHISASFEALGPRGADPFVDFGLPHRDTALRVLEPSSEIYWTRAERLTSGHLSAPAWVPSELVFSPPPVVTGEVPFTVGSTNGVSTGATVAEATAQGLLELVERASYWYYMRNNLPGLSAAGHLPDAVRESVERNQEWSFTFSIYPNRFGIPVAQCVAQNTLTGSCSRGMGASLNLTRSVERAYLECLQMATSLGTGVDVEPSDEHMRHIWHSGESAAVFDAAFEPVEDDAAVADLTGGELQLDPAALVDRLLDLGVNVFRVVLADFEQFAVVRLLASGMSVDDPYHFHNGRYTAVDVGPALPPPTYTGTLFM